MPNHLKEAIECILSQIFTDFEFLILDDCPENNREAVIKSFKDMRIKLFGIIPLGYFIQKGNKRQGILKYLPFITTKMKLEVK